MPDAAVTKMSNSEIVNIAKKIVDKTGLDSFRILVRRRNKNVGLGMPPPSSVATFNGAQLIHLASPEPWLGRIVDSAGTYYLRIWHEEDAVTPIADGSEIEINKDGPDRPPSVNRVVTLRNDWSGPAKLIDPAPSDHDMEEAERLNMGLKGRVGNSNANGNAVNVNGTNGVASTPQNPISPPPMVIAPTGSLDPETRAAFAAQAQSLEMLKAELASERARAAEERHEAELRMLREGSKREVEGLRNEMKELMRFVKERESAAATAIAPRVERDPLELMAAMGGMLERLMAVSRPVSAPVADPNALSLRDALEMQSKMYEKLSDRSRDPMMDGMSTAMSTMMQTMMNAVHLAADTLNPGAPSDPPAVLMAKEVVRGIETVGRTLIANKQADLAVKRELRGASGQTQNAPRAGAVPARGAIAGPPQRARRNGGNATAAPTPTSALDQIKNAVFNEVRPADVASAIIDAFQNDTDFKMEALKYGGDFDKLVEAHFNDWIAQDQNNRIGYLQAVAREVQKQSESVEEENKREPVAARRREEGDDGEKKEKTDEIIPKIPDASAGVNIASTPPTPTPSNLVALAPPPSDEEEEEGSEGEEDDESQTPGDA